MEYFSSWPNIYISTNPLAIPNYMAEPHEVKAVYGDVAFDIWIFDSDLNLDHLLPYPTKLSQISYSGINKTVILIRCGFLVSVAENKTDQKDVLCQVLQAAALADRRRVRPTLHDGVSGYLEGLYTEREAPWPVDPERQENERRMVVE